MSVQMKIQKDNAGKITNIMLNGVTMYYTCIRKPMPIYDDRKLAYEKARKEWKITVAVDEETADAWDEIFTKQPSKKYTNAKFMEEYKLEDKSELPFPDDKKQYTIKITQKAQKKDGTPSKAYPQAFVVEDGKAVEITQSKNIGNGSKGAVKIRVMQNDFGTFAYLDKVRVDSLVEYADADGGDVSKDDMDFLGAEEVEREERKVEEPVEQKGSYDEPSDMDGDDDFGEDDVF